MDELFRLVFNNKVIRKKIFEIASSLNKKDCNIPENDNNIKNNNNNNNNYKLIGYKLKDENEEKRYQIKKYGQCKINWICQNKHFQLLIYKLKVEIKKRIEFHDDLFYKCFLKFNSNLQLLKEILKLYPNYLPNDKINNNSEKLIQYCSSWEKPPNSSVEENTVVFGNLKIIKYLVNELNIKPTLISLNNACGSINDKLVEFYLFNDHDDSGSSSNSSGSYGSEIIINKYGFNIKKVIDIGTLYCSIKSNNFNLFKKIIEIKSEIVIDIIKSSSPISYSTSGIAILIRMMINTQDVKFIQFYCEFIEKEFKDKNELQLFTPSIDGYTITNGNLEIIKYLSPNKILLTFDYLSNYIAIRGDLPIIKFFIQEYGLYEKLSDKSKSYFYSTLCSYGNLDAILYLENTILPKYKLLVDQGAIDKSLSSPNLNVFYWLVENRKEGCSDNGFKNVCKNFTKFEKECNILLIKYRNNISNDTILHALSHYKPFRNLENFNYLSSFLPTYLVPDKKNKEFYDDDD